MKRLFRVKVGLRHYVFYGGGHGTVYQDGIAVDTFEWSWSRTLEQISLRLSPMGPSTNGVRDMLQRRANIAFAKYMAEKDV